MGVKIEIYCYLIADIGCHGNQNVNFVKKIYKNHLLRSYKGDKAETFVELFIILTSIKILLFIAVKYFGCFGNFKFPWT